jgi:Domain of unknown function (DUF1906)
MRRVSWIPLALLAGVVSSPWANLTAQSGTSTPVSTHLGFDRNVYPGDENLSALRRTFSFTGFWLNPPPGETTNTWMGKRQTLQSADFGFLLLFNGRLYKELRTISNAGRLGKNDAQAALASARREGFPAGAIIFLDQEEGGRMLPEQRAYIHAWADSITAAGFRPGIYCSGIAAKEDGNVSATTAEDIRQNAGERKLAFWIANDACPPSPGCAYPKPAPRPAESGIDFAEGWQFAQSPKRRDVAAGCPANYNRDGSCYPPGLSPARGLHVDLDTATRDDPSQGRTH